MASRITTQQSSIGQNWYTKIGDGISGWDHLHPFIVLIVTDENSDVIHRMPINKRFVWEPDLIQVKDKSPAGFAHLCWQLALTRLPLEPTNPASGQRTRAGHILMAIHNVPADWVNSLQMFCLRIGVCATNYNGNSWFDSVFHQLEYVAGVVDARFPDWALDLSLPIAGVVSRRSSTLSLAVLVGDTPSSRAVTPWPFTLPTGSSAVMAAVMTRLVSTDPFTIINVNQPVGMIGKGEEALDLVLGAPNVKRDFRIVALGRNAQDALQRRGFVPTCTIVHPSVIARFHRQRVDDYANVVRWALSNGPGRNLESKFILG